MLAPCYPCYPYPYPYQSTHLDQKAVRRREREDLCDCGRVLVFGRREPSSWPTAIRHHDVAAGPC